MKTVSSSVSGTRERLDAQVSAILYGEGLAAGLLGAVTVAVWFFVLDLLKGRPLYTPAILGQAIFHGDASTLQQPETPFELIVAFTWLHGMVFCAIGLIGAWLIHKAEVSPHFGYGIALLSTVMLSGFIVICMFIAEPILHAITIPSILIGNLLAMTTMGVFFWRRHPKLRALP